MYKFAYPFNETPILVKFKENRAQLPDREEGRMGNYFNGKSSSVLEDKYCGDSCRKMYEVPQNCTVKNN